MSTLQENQSLNAEYERNKKEREMKEEIERLNKENKELNKICARKSHYIDKKDLEIGRLNNIIELALDYLDNGYCYCKDKIVPKPYFDYQELMNILKGVDKE